MEAITKKQIIELVDGFASSRGLRRGKEYTWIQRGPTFVYKGTKSPHHGLAVGDVKRIQGIGALFVDK